MEAAAADRLEGLAAVVLFGAAAYLGLLVWGEPELVREVWTLIRGRGR